MRSQVTSLCSAHPLVHLLYTQQTGTPAPVLASRPASAPAGGLDSAQDDEEAAVGFLKPHQLLG